VKTMVFPAAMSGKEKREKMAIMETAISSSLSHPNIVQTYTYVVKPITGELAAKVCQLHVSITASLLWQLQDSRLSPDVNYMSSSPLVDPLVFFC